MRSNIVSEAGVPTRLAQWWQGIPFLTSSVVITCGFIYLICLLVGYDSFVEICFLPSAIITRFQVYRMYTAIFFHASVLHVLFNMMALVPLGSELERIMGSIRMLFAVFLLASSNAILHLFIAIVVAHNPFHHEGFFMNECGIGFSGILFSMIVIETSLNGVQSRSVFGLFNVPAKWYAWILLIVFQLLMTNVSLLGHLCGILSGFAYTNGLFNSIMPGSSFLSSIEALYLLSSCVRQPKFILCSGGNSSGYIPTFSSQNSSVVNPGNILRNISSWFPRREISEQQATEDNLRFPGQGRVLGSTPNQMVPDDSGLQTRLLDGSNLVNLSDSAPVSRGNAVSDERKSDGVAAAVVNNSVDDQAENTRQLVSMGFEKTQVDVALAASDGDLDVAVEILMSQQG